MSLPRYAEYKESGVEWLIAVPAHWRIEPVKAVATINDDALPESTDPMHTLEYVDIGNVSLDRGIERTETLLFQDAPSRARRIARDGDVIVSTVRTYLKAIAAVTMPPPNLVVSTGFAVIRPQETMKPSFAKYAMQSTMFVDAVISRSTGVSYPTINASDLSRIAIPIPPLFEQAAIAAFLDRETNKIDALIVEQEKLIALLAEKRLATISHAVTHGLNLDVPMKDSGIAWLGEVPAHWVVAKLGLFAAIENGTTPSRAVDEYWEGGDIPWLASGEVNQLQITEASELITKSALENCSLRLLPVGTVVVGMIGQGKTRGMAAVLRITATINQNLAAIRPSEHIDSSYLLYVLQAMYEWLREAGRGGNQAAMNCEMLSALRVPLPSIEEQQDIALFIEAETAKLESLRMEAERAISLLKERRSALITATVTGQIDVRDVMAPQINTEEAAAA